MLMPCSLLDSALPLRYLQPLRMRYSGFFSAEVPHLSGTTLTTLLYICGPPKSPECHRSLQIMTSTCEELGVPLAKQKVAGPASCMTVLGIEIDTKAGLLRLPHDKFQRLKALLVSWQH